MISSIKVKQVSIFRFQGISQVILPRLYPFFNDFLIVLFFI